MGRLRRRATAPALLWWALAALLWAAPSVSAAEPVVRVLVERGASALELSGLDLKVERLDGSPVLQGAPGAVRLGARVDGRISVGDRIASAGPLRVWSPAVFVWVDGRELRGPVMVEVGTDGLMAIDLLPLEAYLVGVVGSEVPVGWPPEALRAQAIVARSYAVARLERSRGARWDVEATTRDQVYSGASREDPRAVAAVRDTAGQVLTRGGVVVEAYFHAICGGATESPDHVWEGRGAYPSPVRCDACADAPSRAWRLEISASEMAERLRPAGALGAEVRSLECVRRGSDGRWVEVRVRGASGEVVLAGNELRRLLGYGALRSLRFTAEVRAGRVVFEGVGYGHGVGLCQWGARGMAAAGADHRAIVHHYFPGATLGIWAGADG